SRQPRRSSPSGPKNTGTDTNPVGVHEYKTKGLGRQESAPRAVLHGCSPSVSVIAYPRSGPFGTGHDDSNVIFAPGLIGGLHEGFRGLPGTAGTAQDGPDRLVLQHRIQPVGAEQEHVPGKEVLLADVRHDVPAPEGAGDDVAELVAPGLVGGQAPL